MLVAYAMNGIGAVGLLVSWWGVSGSVQSRSQLAWLNLGIGALVVLGVGNVVWLLVGRRRVGESIRRARDFWGTVSSTEFANIADDVDADAARLRADRQSGGAKALGATRYLAVKNASRFHREDCDLVIDKKTIAASPAVHLNAGRRPCEICKP